MPHMTYDIRHVKMSEYLKSIDTETKTNKKFEFIDNFSIRVVLFCLENLKKIIFFQRETAMFTFFHSALM